MLFERFSDQKERVWNWLTKKPYQTDLRTGMTLIGPAKFIKKIKKNPDSFSVLAESK